jgi:hypothetical protein
MVAGALPSAVSEEVIAELAAVAYRVALRHGLRAPFIDVELDLWRELRAALGVESPDSPEVVPCPR